jgi:hypothetical protein
MLLVATVQIETALSNPVKLSPGLSNQGGKNVQTTSLAERSGPYGFGRFDLPRLRGRIFIAGIRE